MGSKECSAGRLRLIRMALREFALEADKSNPIHCEFIHATRDLLMHEFAKDQLKRRSV